MQVSSGVHDRVSALRSVHIPRAREAYYTMPPQEIVIYPSRRLALILVLSHAGAAAAAGLVDMPSAAHAGLAAAIVGNLSVTLLRFAFLKSGDSITAIRIDEAGELVIRLRSGSWRTARLLETSFVSPYLTIVNVRTADSYFAQHAVLMPDNVSHEDFRRLRVWLRWKRPRIPGPVA